MAANTTTTRRLIHNNSNLIVRKSLHSIIEKLFCEWQRVIFLFLVSIWPAEYICHCMFILLLCMLNTDFSVLWNVQWRFHFWYFSVSDTCISTANNILPPCLGSAIFLIHSDVLSVTVYSFSQTALICPTTITSGQSRRLTAQKSNS